MKAIETGKDETATDSRDPDGINQGHDLGERDISGNSVQRDRQPNLQGRRGMEADGIIRPG